MVYLFRLKNMLGIFLPSPKWFIFAFDSPPTCSNATKLWFLLIAIPFTFGCRQRIDTDYSIPGTKLAYRKEAYLKQFGKIESLHDTMILQSNLQCYYSNGELKKIGKLDRNKKKPTGYWFEFDEYQNVVYILHYKAKN